ncbi:BON domain-containing protein [Paraburkholderia sp. LEh10]|uniref:BON domain-containing protein n=1 Tax=Paraburkholderia sp. LEh10 TaxID=2821353 RepID=UPI001AE515D7|nr:BON domain-containing protein [Paraburkholderia sp. LEh10]
MIRICGSIAAVVILATLFGTTAYATTIPSTHNVHRAGYTSSDKAADKQLRKTVRRALSKGLGPDAENIIVVARGGAITLSGSTPDPGIAKRAEDLARGVSGVSSVSNRITIRSAP